MKSSFVCRATGIKEGEKEKIGKRGKWNTCFQSQVQKVVGSGNWSVTQQHLNG